MFCSKCGAQVPDGNNFCPKCGNPMEAPTNENIGAENDNAVNNNPAYDNTVYDEGAQYQSIPNQYGMPTDKKKLPTNVIAIIIGVAALALIIVLGFLIFGGNSAKSVAEDTYEAMFDCDGDKYLDGFHDCVIDYMIDNSDDCDSVGEMADKFSESFEDEFKDLDEDYDFEDFEGTFDDWSIDVEATKEKDLKDSDIDDLQEDYEDTYDFDGEIKAAKKVTLKITVEDDDDHKQIERQTVTVIKIGGTWYLYSIIPGL